ncbi:MAG: glyoxalase/bleomycin resistance/extradiol dioxygenase family protein [Myxococcales bacterium]|nr:glyoxalase/bleomycin resistance/extradiol dioxygenase family protein [Myxococcales bacterium]
MTTAKKSRSIFVNLPVANLEKTKAFFQKLGFSFNAQFTDEKAACMVLSELGYVMLLDRTFFKTFTKREIAGNQVSEALIAISCENRAEVDQLVKTALENGGSPAMPPMDHGFMYASSFYDVDGHHWEVLWMDPAHVTPET